MRQSRGSTQHDVRVGGCKIDDGPAAARDHSWPNCFTGEKHYVKFSTKRAAPLILVFHLLDRCECAERRGIHENVDASKSFHRCRDQTVHVLGLRQIARMNARHVELLISSKLKPLFRGGRVYVATHDLRAMSREHQSAAPSDA